MPSSEKPIELFCSYAPADEKLYQELENHLSPLRRQGLVSIWHPRDIVAGTDWSVAIDTHVNGATVILLLISSDFFASDYRYGVEMKRALERHQANEARVIPILLRPVEWKGAPFEHLEALPTDARPVTTWPNLDEAFADVASGIRRAIEDLTSPSANQTALLPTATAPLSQPSAETSPAGSLRRGIPRRAVVIGLVGATVIGAGGYSFVRLVLDHSLPSDAQVLFRDSFQSDPTGQPPTGWHIVAGTWVVGTQALEQTDTNPSTAKVITVGSTSWTDYGVQAQIKPGSTGRDSAYSLNLRYRDNGNKYSAYSLNTKRRE